MYKETLSITINHKLEKVDIVMSSNKTSNLAMLATLMNTMCEHYDMAESELLEIMEDLLLEEE